MDERVGACAVELAREISNRAKEMRKLHGNWNSQVLFHSLHEFGVIALDFHLRAERASLKRAVQGARRAAFALQLDDLGNRALNIFFASERHWSANSPMGEAGVMG